MYIIYESYTDEIKNMKEKQFNTKIVGIYNDKKVAIQKLQEHLEQIELGYEADKEWFIKPYEKKLLKDENKNLIKCYQIFNEYIGNFEEIFYVILEKVGD